MKDGFSIIDSLKNFKTLKLKVILYGLGLIVLIFFITFGSFFFEFKGIGSSFATGNGEYSKYEPGKGICNLIIPLKSSYSISSLYGYRVARAENASSFHPGIDLAVASGTNVYAAFSGVATTGGSPAAGSGYYVRIKNESGEVVKYYHLSKILVQNNQKVEQGDLVAKSGNTGISSGPHLHFEFVDANGKTVSLNNMFGYTDIPECVKNTGAKSEAERRKCNKNDSRKMSELEKTQFKNACAGVSTVVDENPTTPDESSETEEVEQVEENTTEETTNENILGSE